ncbi:MAG: hypothetical protein KGY70_16290 [Bacteroidales bacterium]|nr:hypothetical protein [Bacteroidales bacterium]
MKVKVETKQFTPVDLTITFENREELNGLKTFLGQLAFKTVEKIMNSSSENPSEETIQSTYDLTYSIYERLDNEL